MEDDDLYCFSDLPTIQKPETKIWRYLTPDKFSGLLKTRMLFFPSTWLFEDPNEGSYPDENRRTRDHLWELFNVSSEQREIIEWNSQVNRLLTYVSCWHISDHESAALWKIYGRVEKAVAVQSTLGRITKCLPDFVHIHPVTYLDYTRDRIPTGHSMHPFFFKRREFRYEEELRVVTGDLPISDPRRGKVGISLEGWSFPIIPDELIETVYVGPGCSEVNYNHVKSESVQMALKASVLRSAMDRKPRL
jgi:hypothetical protein